MAAPVKRPAKRGTLLHVSEEEHTNKVAVIGVAVTFRCEQVRLWQTRNPGEIHPGIHLLGA